MTTPQQPAGEPQVTTRVEPHHLQLARTEGSVRKLARRIAKSEAAAVAEAVKDLKHDADMFHWVMERCTEAVDLVENYEGWNGTPIGQQMAKLEQVAKAKDAEIKRLTEELESHAWEVSPAMAQAKIEELNRKVKQERERAGKVADYLAVILPMAKGYAAAHPVGNNQSMVSEAESALAAYRAGPEGGRG